MGWGFRKKAGFVRRGPCRGGGSEDVWEDWAGPPGHLSFIPHHLMVSVGGYETWELSGTDWEE